MMIIIMMMISTPKYVLNVYFVSGIYTSGGIKIMNFLPIMVSPPVGPGILATKMRLSAYVILSDTCRLSVAKHLMLKYVRTERIHPSRLIFQKYYM